jgi:predicted O-methyltransferase YrrM
MIEQARFQRKENPKPYAAICRQKRMEEQLATEPSDSLKAQITDALRMTGEGLMEGWVTADKGIAIAELVVKHKPEICVEIGVFGGRSLVATALALKENKWGKVYGIDPWKTDDCLEGDQEQANKDWWAKVDMHDIHKKCMEAIWKLDLDGRVVIIRSKAQHATALFKRIDFLTIDGNHSETSSCRDVELYCPRLKVGAPVIFDDADWPSTKKAQELILKYCDLVRDCGSWRVYSRK